MKITYIGYRLFQVEFLEAIPQVQMLDIYVQPVCGELSPQKMVRLLHLWKGRAVL